MKKTTLLSAIVATTAIAAMPTTASAGVTGLNLTSGAAYNCNAGAVNPDGTCKYGTNVASGSWFAMDDGNGTVQNGEKVRIDALTTLDFNNTTAATGSHAGSIDGSESPVSDIWEFFGGTGMDYLTAPMVDNGDGTVDMSGWAVTWNGVATIPMGGDAGQGDTSLAALSCGACGVGDAFTLTYSAHVPLGDDSGFGGVLYSLNLEGTVASVSAVPVPAAVWLFGSGLLGLVGVARRKSHA